MFNILYLFAGFVNHIQIKSDLPHEAEKTWKNIPGGLAKPELFWYYIRAFRTGADFPHVAGFSGLVEGLKLPEENNKKLEEIKCQ